MLVAALGLAACGDELDPAHEVKTLRVFAVSKDPSVARPGGDVTMRMLWHEPREARATQLAWIAGCWNPEGDLFYGCFEQIGAQVSNLEGSGSFGDVGVGDRFTVSVPNDIISSRPPPSDPNRDPYGLGFVFFAACAGTLGAARGEAAEEFPVACYDDAGRALGPDDFVIGYVEVFAADEGENRPPAFRRVDVGRGTISLDCIGDACVDDDTAPAAIDCAAGDPRCVRCVLDEDGACEALTLEVDVDPASIEVDPLATKTAGEERYEQTWVRYYADGGELDGDIRVAADPTTGPRGTLTMDFVPPRTPGEVRLWLTLHDSRGGATWTRFRLKVE